MSAAPFKVKAVYEYKSSEPDDLNFPNGQIITVTAEEDDDWYTGNYLDAAGSAKEGLFPKNFVEKYEPAVPSRPKRTPKVETSAEAPTPVAAPQEPEESAPSRKSLDTPRAPELETIPAASPPAQAPVLSPPSASKEPFVAAAKSVPGKPPPPVAEKPSSGSFRDRIAAFNKTAAPPPTPFKPATQNSSTGFIKKPFVAPPPSKNAYVPPPREQPPQRVYRREEDPEIAREEPTTATERAAEVPPPGPEDEDDARKPMTLKERMALLQKQQLEQAQRHAEGQKKEKPKRPPRKRVESTEAAENAEMATAAPIERTKTDETVGKKSVDFADDEAGPLRGNSKSSHNRNTMATPPPPSRELVSDTNDADDSGAGDTEDYQDISTEEERPQSKHGTAEHVPGAFVAEPDSTPHSREAEAADEDEEENADDTDEDPDVRRRREIRDRMAKMSGGMGMMGMFGPPGGMPGARSGPKPRQSTENERQTHREQGQEDDMARAPPVPIMAMPGMTRHPPPPADDESDEATAQRTPQESAPRELSDADDDIPAPPTRRSTDRPLVPQDRGLPPPPPREARAVPPPPPTERSVPARAMSNDFASAPPPPSRPTKINQEQEEVEMRPHSKEGLPNLPLAPPRRPAEAPRLDHSPPLSPSIDTSRLSRGPPPIPLMSPSTASPQTRAPPPPPPGQPPSRRSTIDSRASSTKNAVEADSEGEITEYDGDYDTDIASSAKHKDALKSHNRDSSLDDGILTDEAASKSPTSPPARAVPSIPNTSTPRDIPPPPPQGAPKSRKSLDAPRAAPPPVPPPKEAADAEDYDPFRYNQPVNLPPSRSIYASALASPAEEMEEDDMYDPTPTATRSMPQASSDRSPPPPPSSAAAMTMPMPGRPSMEAPRTSMQARRSMEQSRPSGEHGIMATDIDLGQSSMWWTQQNTPPPALQTRQDVLYEIESSTSTKRGGKATTSTDVYVLYPDYSQTTINATFDPQDPSHAILEQRHERPPPPLRKDQLESASSQFGSVIASAAASKVNTTIGSGSANELVLFLMEPLKSQALIPIGTRAFGALVYANLANTSTQVFDEIRPGDIVTFRNAKFGGHKGGLYQKYTVDVGMGKEHVGVVAEWDGTKKKIRAWEQGREEKGKKSKVKEESWKMGDLRSGEVRVWRVMGRQWVGWDSAK